jgi:hypothetical protein
MPDTPRDIEDRVVSMMAARTPAQRVRMACSMFEAGRAMLRAGLRQRHGNISENRMRSLVFQTMYKDDFTTEEMKKILNKIPNMELL